MQLAIIKLNLELDNTELLHRYHSLVDMVKKIIFQDAQEEEQLEKKRSFVGDEGTLVEPAGLDVLII